MAKAAKGQVYTFLISLSYWSCLGFCYECLHLSLFFVVLVNFRRLLQLLSQAVYHLSCCYLLKLPLSSWGSNFIAVFVELAIADCFLSRFDWSLVARFGLVLDYLYKTANNFSLQHLHLVKEDFQFILICCHRLLILDIQAIYYICHRYPRFMVPVLIWHRQLGPLNRPITN